MGPVLKGWSRPCCRVSPPQRGMQTGFSYTGLPTMVQNRAHLKKIKINRIRIGVLERAVITIDTAPKIAFERARPQFCLGLLCWGQKNGPNRLGRTKSKRTSYGNMFVVEQIWGGLSTIEFKHSCFSWKLWSNIIPKISLYVFGNYQVHAWNASGTYLEIIL